MKKTQSKKPIKHKWLIWLALIICVLALLFLDSRFRLVNTEYELVYDSLPKSFDGFRIVQLSDLHMAQFGKNNKRLLKLVQRQQPDIIALTGDFIEKRSSNRTDSQTQELEPFFRELSKIAPCYFVSGNHEWASGELPALSEMLEELEIKYLHNEFVLLEENNDKIILAGVEDPNGPADMIRPDALSEIIDRNYPGYFTVMLAHRNNFLERYPLLSVELVLCGHAHGGMIRLPWLGGVFGTEMDFFPQYDGGLFNEGGYNMVLSRGLGGYVPMPRFLNNPEIVTIILKCSA